MKNFKIDFENIFGPLSIALIIWVFASCEYKLQEQREKTQRLKLMLEHGQDIKKEDYK